MTYTRQITIVPSGTYFVCDPTSLSEIGDKWEAIIGTSPSDHNYCFHFDNKKIIAYPCELGSAFYADCYNQVFYSESGFLGIVNVNDIDVSQLDDISGFAFIFDEDFTCEFSKGIIHFGNLTIDTTVDPSEDQLLTSLEEVDETAVDDSSELFLDENSDDFFEER